jgi:hypothetical protein
MPIDKSKQELLVLTNAELTVLEPLSPVRAVAVRKLDPDGHWTVRLAPEGIERTVDGRAAQTVVAQLNQRYRLGEERDSPR